ncbi:MAG TPA: heme-copper oxidase subunit III [Ktedonobacteraceae bacterium]|nr:heme-copper oxidase subunit III [Ktedonobacteraceae bacterium]
MSTVQGDPVVAAAEHEVAGRSLGWWGMIFFITSEALIFANLIATYLYLEIRNMNGQWSFKLPSGDYLDFVYPLFNTFILLASSVPVRIAGAGIAKGNRRNLVIGLIGTIVLGSIFLAGQAYEYTNLIAANFTIQYKAFGSAFFTLTGFHGLHVTIGVLFLVICLVRAMRGDFTAKDHFAVQAGEMYWHFVDLVWVVVFSTVYLLPLLLRP